MNLNQRTTQSPAPTDCQVANQNSSRQQRVLSEKEKQAEYEKAYRSQLRQQQCPGCGEAEIF